MVYYTTPAVHHACFTPHHLQCLGLNLVGVSGCTSVGQCKWVCVISVSATELCWASTFYEGAISHLPGCIVMVW
jgi:hypothetical protein